MVKKAHEILIEEIRQMHIPIDTADIGKFEADYTRHLFAERVDPQVQNKQVEILEEQDMVEEIAKLNELPCLQPQRPSMHDEL